MHFNISFIAVSTMALGSMAHAAIIYSDLNETAATGESVSLDIAGLDYEFGIQTGGPLDYAYVTTTSEDAGKTTQKSRENFQRGRKRSEVPKTFPWLRVSIKSKPSLPIDSGKCEQTFL